MNTHPLPSITQYHFGDEHITVHLVLHQYTDAAGAETRHYTLTTDYTQAKEDTPHVILVDGSQGLLHLTRRMVDYAGDPVLPNNITNQAYLIDAYLTMDLLLPLMRKQRAHIQQYVKRGMTLNDREQMFEAVRELSECAKLDEQPHPLFTEYMAHLTKQHQIVEFIRQTRRQNTLEHFIHPNNTKAECLFSFKEEEDSTSLYIISRHESLLNENAVPAFQLDATSQGWQIGNQKSKEHFTHPHIAVQHAHNHMRCIMLQIDMIKDDAQRQAMSELYQLWDHLSGIFQHCAATEQYQMILPYTTLDQSFSILVRMVMQSLLAESVSSPT